MSVTEAQQRAVNAYKRKCKRVMIEFAPAERELYEFLCKQGLKATYVKALLRAEMEQRRNFAVIDPNTGEYPNLWHIALFEKWAKDLMYSDMAGFYISEDGELMLADKCGRYAYCPPGRFIVKGGLNNDFVRTDTGL